jgi:putative transposase
LRGVTCPRNLGPFRARFFRRIFPGWEERGDEPKAGAANASKFTDAQKAFVIKQGEEGVPVAEVCRKAGISQATYFAWKKKYAGLMPSEMRRLKQLEEENSGLKRIVADLSRDKEMLQDIVRRKL